MKIVLDATHATDGQGRIVAGIERVSFEIVREIWCSPRGHFWTILGSSALKTRLLSIGPAARGVEFVLFPERPIPFFTRHWWMPFRLRHHDFWFSLATTTPRGFRGKTMLLVHDLSIYSHPEWFPDSSVTNWNTRVGVPESLKRATGVCAVSHWTSDQVLRRFPELAHRLHVTPLAATQLLVSKDEADRFLHPFALPEDVLLTVAMQEPRKNGLFLLKGFERFLLDHPDLVPTTALVWVGGLGWKSDGLRAEIEAVNQRFRTLSPRGVVRYLGVVEEEVKWALYTRARAHALMSFEEGFGLTALEAMVAGCPSIISPGGALPEVSGGAAQMVAFDDVEALSFAMGQFLLIPEVRKLFGQQGRERAQLFSWERTVNQMVYALESTHASTITTSQSVLNPTDMPSRL